MSLLPNTVVNGNCLEVMKEIDDASIDMILCDLPYGATQNSWDSVIPPAPLWEQYERIIKPNGAILLFGQDKFTATMMLSNPKLHRYNIIWDKVLKSGFLNAKKNAAQRARGYHGVLQISAAVSSANDSWREKPHQGQGRRETGGRRSF